MEKNNFISLNVKTVLAFDVESLSPHMAYTVYTCDGNALRVASGWTLRDAIELYSNIYNCERQSLRVKRPFRSQ